MDFLVFVGLGVPLKFVFWPDSSPHFCANKLCTYLTMILAHALAPPVLWGFFLPFFTFFFLFLFPSGSWLIARRFLSIAWILFLVVSEVTNNKAGTSEKGQRFPDGNLIFSLPETGSNLKSKISPCFFICFVTKSILLSVLDTR
jgi:hypothetical protein